MSNDHKLRPSASLLPARQPPAGEPPSLPMLPSSSGAVLGGRTTVLQKDTEFVQTHTQFLRARAEQSDAMRGLVDSRIALAATLARLAAVDQLTAHDFERGAREREHELRMLELKARTDEVIAELRLREAHRNLDAVDAPPASATSAGSGAPQQPAGLTPDEVDELVASLPEVAPETRHTLSLLMKGLIKERKP